MLSATTITPRCTFLTKADALDYIGKDLISAEPAGALYNMSAMRWRFHDGSMAVCHKHNDLWMISWIFE